MKVKPAVRMGFLTREERLVFLTLSVCLIAGGLFQLVNSVLELPEAIRPPEEDNSPATTGGFVDKDGRFEGPDGSTDYADSHASDFTAPLTRREDGTSVAVTGSYSKGPSSDLKAQRPLGKLDLNRATPAELEALPGIGPALAGRIVEQRKIVGGFRSVEDLLSVPGIGEKTLGKFRQWVYVSASR